MRVPSPPCKVRLLFVELAALLFIVSAIRAQNPCPAGAYCNVTFNGTPYTVIGPCDITTISSINACLVVGTGPQPGGPPLQVTGFDAPSQIEQDYTLGTPLEAFDQDAQQHIATLRKITPDELNSYWSRGEIRAYMYLRLLQIAANHSSGKTLSTNDKAVFNYYSNAINTERLAVAKEAKSLYNTWASNPCGFQVPVGDPNAYLNRTDVDNGPGVSPAPCQLLVILGANSIACVTGACTPPTPSANDFTTWAGGVIHQNETNAWAVPLLKDSYLSSLTSTQAQQAATDEYDKAFAGVLEGLDYLTAQQNIIGTIATSAQSAAQQDLNGVWLDAFHDIAADRAQDLGEGVIKTLFQGTYLDGAESVAEAQGGGTTTLGAKFASTPDEFFNAQTDGLEVAIEEDAAGVIAEGFDNIVGPAIAAAAVIAFTTWQAVINGEVPTQLDAGVNCAQFYNPSNPSACDQTTSNPTVATLSDYAQDDNGRQLILTALSRSTMPDYTAARLAGTTANQANVALAPQQGPLVPSDPNFIVNGATAAPTFSYSDWAGNVLTASVANGWFVQYKSGTNPTWLRYASSLAYQYSPAGGNNSVVLIGGVFEQWRAWLNGENFLAIRTGLNVGAGTVQDAINACPGFLAPQGQNTDLGNICVALSAGANTLIQPGDTIVINGEARTVQGLRADGSGNYYAQTKEPFGDTPSGNIVVLTHPDNNCLTSNSLSPRTSSPDCISGKTINTSFGTITLNSKAATASFDISSVNLLYGGTINLAAGNYFASNSTGTVTYSLGKGSYGCAVTPQGVVTATAASTAFNGKCVITASQAGAGQYTPPAPQTSSFSIGQRPVTIKANPLSKPYGVDLNQILGGTATTVKLTGVTEQAMGLLGSDVLVSVVAQSDGGGATAGIGSYSIMLSQAMICNSPLCNLSFGAQGTDETANYAITYDNSALLTVTQAALNIMANNQSKTYGQTFTVPPNGYTVTGLANSDSVSSVTLTATGAAANAAVTGGPYYITPSAAVGSGLGNYKINYFAGTLTINPANLLVTANSFVKTYGQTLVLPSTAFTTKGLLLSDSVASITLTSAGATATATVAGSPYAVVPSLAVGSGLGNYSITYSNGTLQVNPALLTLTANNEVKTYGQSLSFTGTEFMAAPLLNGDTLGTITLTSAGTPPTAPVSGSPYAIVPTPGSATGAAATNYTITYVNGYFTVKPAPLTITASSNTVVIGGPVPAITASYAGFVNNEGPNSMTTQPTCKSSVTSSSAAGIYTGADTCIGAVDTNYAFTYVAGTMKVTYNVPALFSQTSTNSGSTLPVKVQLQNYGGTDLSSSTIILTVTGLTPSPAPGVPPRGVFTYMSISDSGPMYQLNVKTTGYPAGTYTLMFTVTGDPIQHTVSFVVN